MNSRQIFSNDNWILAGDFNSPISNLEKRGGTPISKESKQDLSDFINTLGLVDLELSGSKFTWSNSNSGVDLIQVILDRGSFLLIV